MGLLELLSGLPPLVLVGGVVGLLFIVAGAVVTVRSMMAPPEHALHPDDVAPGAIQPVAPSLSREKASEPLLRVVEDAQGQCFVEVDGRRYPSLADVPETARPAVLRAVAAVVQFGMTAPVNAPGESAPEAPGEPAPDISLRPITTKPVSPREVDATRKRQHPGRMAGLVAALSNAEPVETPQPAFIAVINDILKRKLDAHPALAGRTVRLHTGPDGDLQVHDDTQVFPSVDEVLDDNVRDLIRQSISEWEKL